MTDTSLAIEVKGLSVAYPIRKASLFRAETRILRAVNDVSFAIRHGETLSVVGESGSGKSTIAKAIMGRAPVTGGEIYIEGERVDPANRKAMQGLRRRLQMVFQDPYASLNPRHSIGYILSEPLIVHGLARNETEARPRVSELLDMVGLPQDAATRYPYAFSGGQRQRISIARALATNPSVIVADEPVSALDVSIRAQVINIMADLQAATGTTYLVIAHDLALVRHMSHRVAVLYAGSVVEIGSRDQIFGAPRHPYTRALIRAVLPPDPTRHADRKDAVLAGEPADVTATHAGCSFASRCPLVRDRCCTQAPALRQAESGHDYACWET